MRLTNAHVGTWWKHKRKPNTFVKLIEVDFGPESCGLDTRILLKHGRSWVNFSIIQIHYQLVDSLEHARIENELKTLWMLRLQYKQHFYKKFARKHPRLAKAWKQGFANYTALEKKYGQLAR